MNELEGENYKMEITTPTKNLLSVNASKMKELSLKLRKILGKVSKYAPKAKDQQIFRSVASDFRTLLRVQRISIDWFFELGLLLGSLTAVLISETSRNPELIAIADLATEIKKLAQEIK